MSEYEGLGKGFQIISEIVYSLKENDIAILIMSARITRQSLCDSRDEHSEIESYES